MPPLLQHFLLLVGVIHDVLPPNQKLTLHCLDEEGYINENTSDHTGYKGNSISLAEQHTT